MSVAASEREECPRSRDANRGTDPRRMHTISAGIRRALPAILQLQHGALVQRNGEGVYVGRPSAEFWVGNVHVHELGGRVPFGSARSITLRPMTFFKDLRPMDDAMLYRLVTAMSRKQKEILEQFRETETGDECPESRSFFSKLKDAFGA